MLLRVIGTLAALLLPISAQAHDWWALNLDGNRCLNKDQLQTETIQNGGGYLFATPEQFMAVLRHAGFSPEADVKRGVAGMLAVFVGWTGHNGQSLSRVFFSSPIPCQRAVDDMMSHGVVADPRDLR